MNKYFISYNAIDIASNQQISDTIIIRLFEDQLEINTIIFKINNKDKSIRNINIINISKL